MLQAMRGKGIETYATYTSDEEREALPKECVALRIPHFKSKFKYASIKEVRSIIKKYRIDVIYASSSIDLSIALFASWGTPARVVGYRGTQAKIRRSDPTYYLGILNPRIAHVMCCNGRYKTTTCPVYFSGSNDCVSETLRGYVDGRCMGSS